MIIHSNYVADWKLSNGRFESCGNKYTKHQEHNQSEYAGTTQSSHSDTGDAYDESSLTSLLNELRKPYVEFTNKVIDGIEVEEYVFQVGRIALINNEQILRKLSRVTSTSAGPSRLHQIL